ncbi:hypothetical protein D3C71_2031890 [compost metagenome]
MAEACDHVFDIERDQRFVFDDENFGRHLARDVLRSDGQQLGKRRLALSHDFGGIGDREAFD